MSDEISIFGIAGSLRNDSYNRALMDAAMKMTPEGVKLEVFDDLASIPPYNEDLDWSPPPAVVDLKAVIRKASGALIVTPEYNHGIPGVLKNAIDWASRPKDDNVWDDMPVAVMGASRGKLGSVLAQYQLRQSFVYLNMHPINRPEVMIANAAEQFDGDGNLINETSINLIKELLAELTEAAWQYKERTHEQAFPGFRPQGVRSASSQE